MINTIKKQIQTPDVSFPDDIDSTSALLRYPLHDFYQSTFAILQITGSLDQHEYKTQCNREAKSIYNKLNLKYLEAKVSDYKSEKEYFKTQESMNSGLVSFFRSIKTLDVESILLFLEFACLSNQNDKKILESSLKHTFSTFPPPLTLQSNPSTQKISQSTLLNKDESSSSTQTSASTETSASPYMQFVEFSDYSKYLHTILSSHAGFRLFKPFGETLEPTTSDRVSKPNLYTRRQKMWFSKLVNLTSQVKLSVGLSGQIIKPEKALDFLPPDPTVTFETLSGLESIRQKIRFFSVLPDALPFLFSPARPLLMYGLPGTGKTMVAKAISNLTITSAASQQTQSQSGKMPTYFWALSSSTILSKFVGEGGRILQETYEYAQAVAEASGGISFIFIDEIESFLGDRGSAGTSQTGNSSLVGSILTLLEGVKGFPRVKTIAATNFPWKLDKALLNRFGTRIHLGLPSLASRKSIILQFMEERMTYLDSGGFFAKFERWVDWLAHMTGPQFREAKEDLSKFEGYRGIDVVSTDVQRTQDFKNFDPEYKSGENVPWSNMGFAPREIRNLLEAFLNLFGAYVVKFRSSMQFCGPEKNSSQQTESNMDPSLLKVLTSDKKYFKEEFDTFNKNLECNTSTKPLSVVNSHKKTPQRNKWYAKYSYEDFGFAWYDTYSDYLNSKVDKTQKTKERAKLFDFTSLTTSLPQKTKEPACVHIMRQLATDPYSNVGIEDHEEMYKKYLYYSTSSKNPNLIPR